MIDKPMIDKPMIDKPMIDKPMIDKPMKITIITVVYNCADHIGDCIRSVAHQVLPAGVTVEHIVIDGNSTDGTQEVVRGFGAAVSVFVSERDGGVYFAMNKGIERATGDVVAFLNADDMYAHPQVLQAVATTFLNNPTADALYADAVFVKRDNSQRIFRFWKGKPMYPRYFEDGEIPHHLTLFIRAEALRKTGLIHTAFRVSADYDLMLRLFKVVKATGHYVEDLWTVQRLGGISNRSLKNIAQGNLEIIRAWWRNGFGFPVLTLLVRRPLKKIQQIQSSTAIPPHYVRYLKMLSSW
jgi:glycosyltransferase involved in cell wall biosynthesis